MSIQSEIERINNNVQTTLSTIAETGVSVASDANSDDLPAAASALANEKADRVHFHDYLPLSGGTMDADVTIIMPSYGNRLLKIHGNKIMFDMSNITTGGWASTLASVKTADAVETTMLGAFGYDGKTQYIFIGGTYSDPALKMTTDGQFTFKNAPKVGSNTVLSGTVAIGNGGTGATTVAAARENLSVYSKAEVDDLLSDGSGDFDCGTW